MPGLGLIDDGSSRLSVSRQKNLVKWTELAQMRFLAAYGETGSLLKSWRAAKVGRDMHYIWMKRDPTYPPRFKEAEKRAVDRLRDEAIRRARDGVRRPVLYKGKPVKINGEILYQYEYSDAVLMFMLKSLDPDTFKDRTEVSTVWDGNIDSLSDKQLEEITNHVFTMAFGGDKEAAAEARKQIEAELKASEMTVNASFTKVEEKDPSS